MIIGSKRIYFDRLTSTNSYIAQHLITNDLLEGTIVQTGFQTAGKGQMGNKWESEEGKNLIFSIILYPSMILPSEQFLISMAISLGINDYLSRHTDKCKIKWPNDIYVKDDKIAGILIENSILGNTIENTIAGIGLNINQDRFISDAPNPVSLSLLTGKKFNLNTCLDQLATDLDKRYKQLIAELFTQIRHDYISQLYRLNEWYSFSDQGGVYSGRILSITDYGRLQIERKNGKISEYAFKEIDFIP